MLTRRSEAGAAASESPKVVDHTIALIRHRILEGFFAPGQRLVENELTQSFGVSRGPLREALQRLAADGLIDIAPYRGAAVTRVSRTELTDTLKVRESLEGLAARLAAERIDHADNRARAEEVRASLVTATTAADHNVYLDENDAFHRFIVALSGNTVLGRQIEQLQLPTLRAAFFKLISAEIRTQSIAEHLELIDAVLAGNTEGAEQLMAEHVHRTNELALRLPDELFRG